MDAKIPKSALSVTSVHFETKATPSFGNSLATIWTLPYIRLTHLTQQLLMWPAKLDSLLRCIQHERMDAIMTKQRYLSDNFKATVALEALRGDKTVQDIAARPVIAAIRAERSILSAQTSVCVGTTRISAMQRMSCVDGSCVARHSCHNQRTWSEAALCSHCPAMIKAGCCYLLGVATLICSLWHLQYDEVPCRWEQKPSIPSANRRAGR